MLHIHEDGGFNKDSLRGALGEAPVILYEVARRKRGLLLAPGVSDIRTFEDLKSRRLIMRQDSAASQRLFETQLEAHGMCRDDLDVTPGCARTEEELAIALHDQKAEVGFGLGALAGLYNLDFVPTHSERLDLAIWRRSYFDPPMQKLITLLRSDQFAQRAREFGGYDLSGLGKIHHNGASG